MVKVHKKYNLAEFSLLLMSYSYSLDRFYLSPKEKNSLRGKKKSKLTYLMIFSIAGKILNIKMYYEYVVPLSNETTYSQYL